MADSGRNAFSSWMNFAFRTVSPMDRRLYDFRPLLETLKNVKNRNFARKINASKRWIQRVIKKRKKKEEKSLSTQFSSLPSVSRIFLYERSNDPRSWNLRIPFFAYFNCEKRRKRRNRDYSMEKRTGYRSEIQREWAKDSKGIRIILLERQGSNPLSIHRAFLPFRRGKKPG